MNKTEEKQALRRIVRRIASDLDPRYLEKSQRAIAAHLLAMPEFQAAECIFCFVGIGWEVDTRPILQAALAQGKTVCVPLCTAPGIMELRQIADLSELQPGAYQIPEPPQDSPVISLDNVDLAILPCLTCNHNGHRLGQGGGYYDRFLSHYRGGTILLCRELLIRDEIPLEPHDMPIPWVLTERGLYEDGIPARLG